MEDLNLFDCLTGRGTTYRVRGRQTANNPSTLMTVPYPTLGAPHLLAGPPRSQTAIFVVPDSCHQRLCIYTQPLTRLSPGRPLLHDTALASPTRLAWILGFLHLGNHLLKRFSYIVVQPCASFRETAAELFR